MSINPLIYTDEMSKTLSPMLMKFLKPSHHQGSIRSAHIAAEGCTGHEATGSTYGTRSLCDRQHYQSGTYTYVHTAAAD